MACLDEKVAAGLLGTAVAAGGVGLPASTATGPAFFAAAVGWLVVVANFGIALGKLAACMTAAGQLEVAALIREKANAIEQEVENF